MLQTGTIVAGYSIDGLLGEGGMATVYRATQLSLDRVVALKLMATELGDDASFRARFKREGQLQAALDHQHIVPVYEAGESEQGLFLAMRLIDGPTLKELILGHKLDPRRSTRLLVQVAHALDAAHQAGLIHRDIKPQNILIDRDDHVYLADFGLTKPLDDTARLTGTGQFIGTIDYVSPEQIQSEAATAASDCYALTAVLYECLVGQVPFPQANEAAVLHAHVVRPPPRPSAVRPELPAALDEVIASGMAKDPAARPGSAIELLRLATRALAVGSTGPPPPAQATILSRPGGEPERGQATRTPPSAAAIADNRAAAAAAGATRQAERTPATVSPGGPVPLARARASPRSRSAMVAAVGAVVLAALAGGFLVGHSRSSSRARLPNTGIAGHVQLDYPSSWSPGSGVPVVPGLTFGERLGLAAPQPGAGLAAGMVNDAAGPTLLPASFRSRLEGSLSPGSPVRLGALQALRFSALHERGSPATLTVYTAPSSAGVATVVCSSPTAAARSFESECDRVAATLRLLGASAYPLGPRDQYARAISRALARLRTATAGREAQLQSAGSAATQANAAAQLGAAYRAAERELSALAVSPLEREAHHAIVAALGQLARGYASAAAAARGGSRVAYGQARASIGAAAGALDAGLRDLGTLGYTVAR